MSPRDQAPEPAAGFESYYGRPVLKEPAWKTPDVPLYLFLGGLSGASSVLAAAADLTGRPGLARVSRVAAGTGVVGSLAALIHDLGRPGRFLNMLRVFKPTSPLSMGSWTIAAYGPLAGAAAAADITGVLTVAGRAAGIGAAVLGPAMATYTAVLIADTAIPAWHDAHAELPFVFGGSAMASAAGVALAAAPLAETGPAARTALAGAVLEIASTEIMTRRLGLLAEPYSLGRAGKLMLAARLLTAAGAAGAALGRRSRIISAVAGASLAAGSVALRFAVFEAGVQSARDPKYTVIPQRERLDERATRTASGEP
ncbi:MAG: NrfD/PsrC family molybdoenzyme membrane anchor subunit [Streptosporangiaceae bacterium]